MAETDRIALTVPVRGEFARTVRLTAGELASRVGMTVDDVDDVKLAVEEAFVFASRHAKGDEVVFSFELGEARMEVLVGPLRDESGADEEEATDERYARFILQSICDEVETLDREDAHFLRLVKNAG